MSCSRVIAHRPRYEKYITLYFASQAAIYAHSPGSPLCPCSALLCHNDNLKATVHQRHTTVIWRAKTRLLSVLIWQQLHGPRRGNHRCSPRFTTSLARTFHCI